MKTHFFTRLLVRLAVRLIAAGTIEEKILRLHASKKTMADALLEGTDMASRLGREEILELLAAASAAD
ncbi:MAG: hypothetical protein IJ164_06275 [Duodenibacillus sp.]|nr:hypothetical protein [Duodenibacillus sp.]